MTDKVQKIREEVERLKSHLLRGACSSQIAMETMCKEEAYNEVLTILDTMQEEPVSEDLEKAAWLYYDKNRLPIPPEWDLHKEFIDFFKAGAKWQKEQFEKNRLKHCNSITNEQAELEQGFIDQHLDKHQRIPTFLDAIEYGMNIQKEQMMKDAVDATVHIDAGGYPYIPQIELYDYDKDVPLAKEGDKYKVILIKED